MSASPAEMVDWIGDDGATIASVSREEIRARNLLHRVTATFVFHPDGRVFVHRRSPNKDVYPSLHDPFVGGTVISGESFLENSCRELEEELGVSGVPIHPLFGHRFRDEVSYCLIRVFACVHAGPLRFQPEEVTGGRWMDEQQAGAMVAAGQVTPDSSRSWRIYLDTHGRGRNFARDIAPRLSSFDCGGIKGKG